MKFRIFFSIFILISMLFVFTSDVLADIEIGDHFKMNYKKIYELQEPELSNEATNKSYVDTVANGGVAGVGIWQGESGLGGDITSYNSGNILIPTMLVMGSADLSLTSIQNLIYGNIAGGSEGNLILMRRDGANKFMVNKDGWVGIGNAITSPLALLHVLSPNNNQGIIIQTTNSENNDINQGIAFMNADNNYTWHMYRTDAGNGQEADLVFASGHETDITALAPRVEFHSNGNVTFTTDSNNIVLIGDALTVNGVSIFHNNLLINADVYADAFYYNSDRNLKTNIVPIENSIEKLSQINGVNFDWKSGGSSFGVIAQEVEKVFPEAVGTNSYGNKTVNYPLLVAPLIEAIKEQQKQIDELKLEINGLKLQCYVE